MFENLLGNAEIKKYLENTLKTQNIPHSFIFCGKSGIGKKLYAKEYAKKLMCLEENTCENTCDSCIKFENNSNPDFCLIEPDGKTIKINQIRELQKKISEKPIIASKKIYVINDAEAMSEESQNCLLKTLEEPPEYATIILIVANESKILATIKSRCVTLRFKKLSNEDIKKKLKESDDDFIELLDGSLKDIENIEEKKKDYKELNKIVDQMINENLLQVLNNSELIYLKKEGIIYLLEYLNIIFVKKNIYETVKIVEKTKQKIQANNNYDMCIDYLLINCWKAIHNNGL